MKQTPLLHDLKALLELTSLDAPGRARIERMYLAQPPDVAELIEVGAEAGLGVFRTLALALKADRETFEADRAARTRAAQELARRRCEIGAPDSPLPIDTLGEAAAAPWQPWDDPARWHALLAAFPERPARERMDVLLLEQWALGCHVLGSRETERLAARHSHSQALLHAADATTQERFVADKREWLREEHQVALLSDVRAGLVDDMERARIAFLAAYQDVYVPMVEAAHRLALWRYRQRLDDSTLSEPEFQERLVLDLADATQPLLPFEPELRTVLSDSVEQLRRDMASLRRVAELAMTGKLRPASPQDVELAALLFRKLARLVHPDALRQHPDYDAISAENRQALDDIWNQASSIHRCRWSLEEKRLLDHVKNLEQWLRQAGQILRHLDFHDPGMIVEGETLEQQCEWIRQSLEEARLYLHALRSDVARLQADPQRREHLRAVALPENKRQAERKRMVRQARAWNRAADEVEAGMRAQVDAQARADAALLKGARA
jgi:hypothetical protein